jgi:hypothetical protein
VLPVGSVTGHLIVLEAQERRCACAVGANDGIGRMHVQLALSGEWQGAAR